MNIIDSSIIFERVTWGQLSTVMWNWHVMDSANYYWYMIILFVAELKSCIDNFRLGFTKVAHEWFITCCWFFTGKRWCPSNMLIMFILCESMVFRWAHNFKMIFVDLTFCVFDFARINVGNHRRKVTFKLFQKHCDNLWSFSSFKFLWNVDWKTPVILFIILWIHELKSVNFNSADQSVASNPLHYCQNICHIRVTSFHFWPPPSAKD